MKGTILDLARKVGIDRYGFESKVRTPNLPANSISNRRRPGSEERLMAARVSIYLNMAQRVAEDGKFYPAAFARMEQPYLPGDPVAMVTAFTSEETDPLSACEEAFEIGNIDPACASSSTLCDLVQRYRAEEVRSLSVGDVVTVDGIAFACKSFGFEKVGLGAGLAFCGGRSAKSVAHDIRAVNNDPVEFRHALAYISTLVRP